MKAAVVGGGVAGLVAAYRLAQAGASVTVLEGAARWGGQIWSEVRGGFLIEYGAEGYAAARKDVRRLCEEDLALTGRLVSQSTSLTLQWCQGRLTPLPPGEAARLVGIQASRADLGRGIETLAGGMGELVEALLRKLTPRASLRAGAGATSLVPTGAGWRISTTGDEQVEADAVVLALPAVAAARLVAPLSATAADTLRDFPTVSSVTVSLAWPRAAVEHDLDAAGFVSETDSQDEGFRACSFTSSVFPGRVPGEQVLLRAFFRPGPRLPLEASDAAWVERARDALGPVLGVRAAPVHSWVARWPDALPRYAPNHLDRVSALREALHRREAPLALAGAAFRPAGIAGAVESAHEAAQRIVAAGA